MGIKGYLDLFGLGEVILGIVRKRSYVRLEGD